MKKKDTEACCSRLGKVGGQAVLEGVMMKAGNRTVTSCRTDDGKIVVNDDGFVSVRKKHKILNIPILRGIINFVEMMILSVKTLGASAEALGIEEEDGKVEKWLKKHLGIGLVDVIMAIGMILGIALALFLFLFLPTLVSDLINMLVIHLTKGPGLGAWRAVVEGAMKVIIFISYLSLVSLMPDIKRTFMYHGAEHKTIACFEAGEELTPENAMKHTRFHPRCGTSFMFFMILLGIIAGLFIRFLIPIELPTIAYTGIRLLILPLLVGVGYEFIMFAGKHDNIFTRVLSAPGLWVQRITTKEPTEDMLEVAIVSTKCALRDDFPEFMEFFTERAWEKTDDAPEISENEIGGDDESADADVKGEESVTECEDSGNIGGECSATCDTCEESAENPSESESADRDGAEA